MGTSSYSEAQNRRHAFVATAVSLFEAEGRDALTLPKLAERDGVDLQDLTEHFATHNDLCAAVVAEGYRRFARAMVDEMACTTEKPRARLVAAGRGYFAFASKESALFQMIFSNEANAYVNGEVLEAMGGAYEVLSAISLPYGVKDPGGRRIAEMRIWAFMHGYAALAVGGNAMFADISELETLLAGILPDFSSV